MTDSRGSSIQESTQKSQVGQSIAWPSSDIIQCPGLIPEAAEIQKLVEELPKRLAVFSYKQMMPFLWVVFLGGTGTGKSTIFNALWGKELSATGVERPKTRGPIVYAHRNCPLENGFPFPNVRMQRHFQENTRSTPAGGSPGLMSILEHERQEWSHLVGVDTPDLDSVEWENRQIAQDLYLLADAVLFVASQEKYADEVPYQFLVRVIRDDKPCFFVLNKAQEPLSDSEVLEPLRSQNLPFDMERIWLIPYAPSNPSQWISSQPAFRDLLRCFAQELSPEKIEGFRQRQQALSARELHTRVGHLLDLLGKENRAAHQWLLELEALYANTTKELIREHKERFAAESREYLKTGIRRLFAKYDLLAKPRRFIKEVLLTPFRLLGLVEQGTPDSHKDALLKIRQRIDLTPVQLVIEKFNRLVLERLSPSDHNSPLFLALRQPGVTLSEEDIKERIWRQQDQLAEWLEQTFQQLAQGIPKGKEWGIYSTSILWGILILTFETTLGGGFTVIDAALDTTLAPFLTKGAAELFAYHEIQKVAHELSQRYQQGLISVVQEQRQLYQQCLDSLTTSAETMESLQTLHSALEKGKTEVVK